MMVNCFTDVSQWAANRLIFKGDENTGLRYKNPSPKEKGFLFLGEGVINDSMRVERVYPGAVKTDKFNGYVLFTECSALYSSYT